MQTFLPLPSYLESARCLDYRRLGKQRVEAFQLLAALGNKWALQKRKTQTTKHGWQNHPAALMWRGYEDALGLYMNVMITEWISRGYNNTMDLYPAEFFFLSPPWFGEERFHASHRANLLRKDEKYYSQFGWTEDPATPYYWPVRGRIV